MFFLERELVGENEREKDKTLPQPTKNQRRCFSLEKDYWKGAVDTIQTTVEKKGIYRVVSESSIRLHCGKAILGLG